MASEAARFGLRYRIIDKASHGALQSQALLVQARTLEQFERYEIAQLAVERGRRLGRIRIYNEGARILEASFENSPGNYPFVLFLPQNETERLLAEHIQAQGGTIEREIALEYFEEHEHGVECVLMGKTGARDTITAAYLVGADGAHSTVRMQLGIPFEGSAPGFDFFLGDLRVEGEVPEDEVAVHLYGGNLVLLGRMDDTHCRVIVALAEHPAREPDVDDFQTAIDVAGIENLRVSDPRWMAAFHVSERRVPACSRGRIFLAGDATNIHSPVGGQGMNSGIQDAANLMWKIALTVSHRAPEELLASYDRERKPVAHNSFEQTSAAARIATASSWLLERIRDGILSRLGSLEPVHEHVHDSPTQVGLHYRHSPIVCECGGSSLLHAGDRAPDCEVIDETGSRARLFKFLNEPLHTALMIAPPEDADLQRFAQLFITYRDIMHGAVLVDGDAYFRANYMQEGGGLYVIRPDGYVGFRGSARDLPALEAWAGEIFIPSHRRS